jgi:DNA (cytosine-5)-methyltransferase 1
MTLGSLFDGIGGFPLAATRAGIRPVWASEILKAPVSITKKHFPEMIHYGDIKKINGAEIEPVDIITFGSPCQDLSVAGRRAGLRGKRSSLFLQAVRIIKEMRVATNNTSPARIVWENVPGAFSTHSGGDFKTVIEEIAGIAEPGISFPRPAGRWLAAGAVLGDCWSVAWRVLDARYWGLPQKRRRVFVIGDFGGQCAGEILFNPKGGPGDIETVGKDGGTDAGNVENGFAEYPVRAGAVPFVTKAFGVYAPGDTGKTLLARTDPRCGDLVVLPDCVRVFTPLEYERLQGYPDYWTLYGHDGRIISDGQRYKALGNSIAVPCVQFIINGIKQLIMSNERGKMSKGCCSG